LGADGKLKIIEAACRIISESGVSAATTRAIAREAGLSTGAIYHYYSNKEDILNDVVERNLYVSTRVAERVISKDYSYDEIVDDLLEITRERFRKIVDSRLQFYLAHEAMMGNEELHKRYINTYDEWIWRAETIVSNFYGFSPTPLNRAIATWIIAAVDGVIFQMLLSTKIVATEDLMKVWEVFLKEGLPHILKTISEMNPDKE
jgi:AcrR family transcriptional regulator